MKNIIFGCKLISFLMVLTVILHWKIIIGPFQMLQQPDIWNGWMGTMVYLIITGILFVLLNLIAAVGLFFLKRWGFIAGYLAIILSTYPLGICYIPFIITLFFKAMWPPPTLISIPMDVSLPMIYMPLATMILINIIIFLSLIYLDKAKRQLDKQAAKPT